MEAITANRIINDLFKSPVSGEKLSEDNVSVKTIERLYNTRANGEGLIFMQLLNRLYANELFLKSKIRGLPCRRNAHDVIEFLLMYLEGRANIKKTLSIKEEKWQITTGSELINLIYTVMPPTHISMSIVEFQNLKRNIESYSWFISSNFNMDSILNVNDTISLKPAVSNYVWSEYLRLEIGSMLGYIEINYSLRDFLTLD